MTENAIAQVVMDVAFDLHRRLGPGLLESVYETMLARRLTELGLEVERQVQITFEFDGTVFDEGFRADLIVGGKVIIEVKAVEHLHPVHSRQLLTYVRLTRRHLGLLINFGDELMKDGFKRIVNEMSDSATKAEFAARTAFSRPTPGYTEAD